MENPEKIYQGYKRLNVYQLAHQLARDISDMTRNFPQRERYVLVDQMKRSSKSVPSNVAEAWSRRHCEESRIAKLKDAAREAREAAEWINIAKDYGYVKEDQYEECKRRYDEIHTILLRMINKADTFFS